MNIYLQAEKELAELLGWTNIVHGDSHCKFGGYLSGREFQNDDFQTRLPQWTQDDAYAFALMVEHELDISFYMFGVNAVDSNYPDKYVGAEKVADHSNDWKQATRYAIVQATIHKLKGK